MLKRKYDKQLDQGAETLINSMTLAAGRMKELISDLLNYSQLQQQKLSFEEINLNDAVGEVVRDLDVPIKEKNATLTIGHLPSVQANKSRLRQLFSNLISNSLKYSKKHSRNCTTIRPTLNERSSS